MRSLKEMKKPRPVSNESFVYIQGASVFGLDNKALLIIPLDVIQGSTKVSTNALINSGAQGNFIDSTFAMQFDTELLNCPIKCQNVDGSTNSSGQITCYAWVKLMMDVMT